MVEILRRSSPKMSSLRHTPILVQEILKLMPVQSIKEEPPLWMLDATFGYGGHTQAVLQNNPNMSVMAMDCDLSAIKWGKKKWGIKNHFPKDRLYLLHGNFQNAPAVLDKHFSRFVKNINFDMIIMDLGVSSPQLGRSDRGFSFYKDGPLDMRMDCTQSLTAGDIVNTWSKKELIDLFYSYGCLRKAHKIVQSLVIERKKNKLVSTRQLADLIIKQTGWRKKGTHPATPYFLALRLAVNQELQALQMALPKMIQFLKPRGRLFVLSFHSLEDRIVKQFFKSQKHLSFCKKWDGVRNVICPSRQEVLTNWRARSAKLRVFEKKESVV